HHVHVQHLCVRMDTGIGPSSHHGPGSQRLAGRLSPQRFLENALHRALVRLSSPPGEVGSVVGNIQPNANEPVTALRSDGLVRDTSSSQELSSCDLSESSDSVAVVASTVTVSAAPPSAVSAAV